MICGRNRAWLECEWKQQGTDRGEIERWGMGLPAEGTHARRVQLWTARMLLPEIVLSMPTISCPECAATDVVKEQHLGSEILWFICAACRNVWCAINPRLSRPVDGGAER